MSRSFARVVTATLAVAVQLVAQPSRVHAQAPRALFSDERSDRNAAPAPPQNDPTVLRSRTATINLTMITAPGAVGAGFAAARSAARTIDLNLFSDVNLVAQLDHVETVSTLGYAWVGSVAGVEASQVILAVADGVFSATVNLPDHVYSVHQAPDGAYLIAEINRRAMRPGAEPLAPSDDGIPESGATGPDGDSGDTFDLLLYYTTAAKDAAGGTLAMNSRITGAIAEVNLTYLQSGITSRLRLVGALEIDYTETGDIKRDLAFGANIDVRATRDRYGADLVTLVISGDPNWAGVAYIMSRVDPAFASRAYSVVTLQGISDALAHELGHNMGCDHEPGNTLGGFGHGAFPYSQGYTDFTYKFFTVMSYGLGCGIGTGHCVGTSQFSSPLNTYKGYPVGTETQDNARTIMETRTTVANFRQSVSSSLGAPTNLVASASGSGVKLTWNPPSSGAPTSYVISAGSFAGGTNLATVETHTNATSFAASGVADGTYYLRTFATDGVAVGPVSNEVMLLVGRGCSVAPRRPPFNLRATVAGSTVSLLWTDFYVDKETTFVLEAGSRPGITDLASMDLNSPSNRFATANAPSGSYYVRVRGKSVCGLSGPSNEIFVVVR